MLSGPTARARSRLAGRPEARAPRTAVPARERAAWRNSQQALDTGQQRASLPLKRRSGVGVRDPRCERRPVGRGGISLGQDRSRRAQPDKTGSSAVAQPQCGRTAASAGRRARDKVSPRSLPRARPVRLRRHAVCPPRAGVGPRCPARQRVRAA